MKDTDQKSSMILDCAATYPNAAIWYHTSNMVLLVDSDAAYITMLEAWSFYARNFYLSDRPSPEPVKPSPKRNGPIHTECKKIHNVVSSAAEAETCGTFNNGKVAINIWPVLIALDHKQPATPLNTDNSDTEGFVNYGMKSKQFKNMGYEMVLVKR